MENTQNSSSIDELLEVREELRDEMAKFDFGTLYSLFQRASFYNRYALISDEDREKYQKEIRDLERRVTFLRGLFS